jgi:hypothetical protein
MIAWIRLFVQVLALKDFIRYPIREGSAVIFSHNILDKTLAVSARRISE